MTDDEPTAAPEGVEIWVHNVKYEHRLVYEGVISGAHHWLVRVPIDTIPHPKDVTIHIAAFPANTAIELFWELPDDGGPDPQPA